jgi:hypothetical protein
MQHWGDGIEANEWCVVAENFVNRPGYRTGAAHAGSTGHTPFQEDTARKV